VKEPTWLDESDVLALHDRLLALHGGPPGVRDDALLKSALARPRQYFAYADSPDVIDMATTYTAGIVRNHPFLGGNKRGVRRLNFRKRRKYEKVAPRF